MDWRNGKAEGKKPQRTELQICTANEQIINTILKYVLKVTLFS